MKRALKRWHQKWNKDDLKNKDKLKNEDVLDNQENRSNENKDKLLEYTKHMALDSLTEYEVLSVHLSGCLFQLAHLSCRVT